LFASASVGIGVDRAEDLVQPEAVLHRQHVLGDQLAGMCADDGDAEDAVAGRGTVSTLTKPSAALSAIARSRSSMP
jgi:hypothetical protein